MQDFGILKYKEMGNLDNRELPKIRDLEEIDEEVWICSSYAFRHETTLHCAERKSKLLGTLQ